MTENAWLTSVSPNALLHHLRPWGRHRRKLQLYVCAWYRDCWRMLNEPCRQLVETCERAAGGLASPSRVATAKRAVAARARQEFAESGTDGLAEVGSGLLRHLRLEHLPGWEGMPPQTASFDGADGQQQGIEEYRAVLTLWQASLLREVIGNPFRRPCFDPAWRVPAVAALAKAVYEERAFEWLPALAEVLEQAGCADEQVLGHFRGTGLHVRGCWALDLVLGME